MNMNFSWIDALIVVAISLLIIAEVLITFQKRQMKKQFLKEFDEYEGKSAKEGVKS